MIKNEIRIYRTYSYEKVIILSYGTSLSLSIMVSEDVEVEGIVASGPSWWRRRDKFLGTSRYKGLPPFPLSRFASAKFVAFLPSFVLSANSNELASQLEIVAHSHDGIRRFCTEWLRVGNFLPNKLDRKAKNLAETL